MLFSHSFILSFLFVASTFANKPSTSSHNGLVFVTKTHTHYVCPCDSAASTKYGDWDDWSHSAGQTSDASHSLVSTTTSTTYTDDHVSRTSVVTGTTSRDIDESPFSTRSSSRTSTSIHFSVTFSNSSTSFSHSPTETTSVPTTSVDTTKSTSSTEHSFIPTSRTNSTLTTTTHVTTTIVTITTPVANATTTTIQTTTTPGPNTTTILTITTPAANTSTIVTITTPFANTTTTPTTTTTTTETTTTTTTTTTTSSFNPCPTTTEYYLRSLFTNLNGNAGLEVNGIFESVDNAYAVVFDTSNTPETASRFSFLLTEDGCRLTAVDYPGSIASVVDEEGQFSQIHFIYIIPPGADIGDLVSTEMNCEITEASTLYCIVGDQDRMESLGRQALIARNVVGTVDVYSMIPAPTAG